MSNTHVMWLTDVNEQTGEEMWECPRCARTLVIHSWQPWKSTVIRPGNENVQHIGSKGGLLIGEVKVNNARQHPNG